MRALKIFLLFAICLPGAIRAGTPEAAALIRNEYEAAARAWFAANRPDLAYAELVLETLPFHEQCLRYF